MAVLDVQEACFEALDRLSRGILILVDVLLIFCIRFVGLSSFRPRPTHLSVLGLLLLALGLPLGCRLLGFLALGLLLLLLLEVFSEELGRFLVSLDALFKLKLWVLDLVSEGPDLELVGDNGFGEVRTVGRHLPDGMVALGRAIDRVRPLLREVGYVA